MATGQREKAKKRKKRLEEARKRGTFPFADIEKLGPDAEKIKDRVDQEEIGGIERGRGFFTEEQLERRRSESTE